jgi:hypothetical protein
MPSLLEQNRIHQQRHRDKIISIIGIDEFRKMKAEQMKLYRAKRKALEATDEPTNAPKKTVVIPLINTNTKTPLMKQPKGLKYKINKVIDTVPSYITRDTALEPTTIANYISKVNMINKIMLGNPLSANIKTELLKLMNNKIFNEKRLFSDMTYLNDIDTVISALRDKYQNDNTFMAYLIAFAVVVSHIPSLRSDYLKITTLAKTLSKQSQDKRDENIADDPNKIIDLSNRQALLDNIKSLPNITDKLIYALNTLIPPRRLEYRFVVITDEIDPDMLKDTNNYLVIRGKWRFIFNEYKTAKSLEQQVVLIPDDLKEILLSYIKSKKLSIGDYLFHLDRSKKEIISQPNFSKKISKVFEKVYGTEISNRYLRYSASTTASNQNLSKKERQQLAHDMGHSLNQNLSYSKHKK